jgi:transposase InsO family protein
MAPARGQHDLADPVRPWFVTPQPHKRPKSSYLRFQAAQPNERWQLDITHWALAGGTEVEILNQLDDPTKDYQPQPKP